MPGSIPPPHSVASHASRILALDVGTSSIKAALISPDLRIEDVQHCEIQLQQGAPGEVEQDGGEIIAALWLVIDAVLAGLAVQQYPATCVLAIQRSTVIAWRAQTGAPLTPALSWQDVRGAAFVASLEAEAQIIKQKSGLVLSPHYGASKLRWLQQHTRGLEEPIHIAPLVSFVLSHLLEGAPYVCDESNAGRTQLFDIRQRCWSTQLCELFGVAKATLPRVKPVCARYGELKHYGIPVDVVCGDQNAAYYALRDAGGVTPSTSVVANFGTGAFTLGEMRDGQVSGRLLHAVGWSSETQLMWLQEGTVNGAGAALEWLRQCGEAGEGLRTHDFHQRLERCLEGTGSPPLFINAIAGLGSPWWRTDIETQFVNPESYQRVDTDGFLLKARAVLESIVFLTYANLNYMEGEQGAVIQQIVCAGGLLRLRGFAQLLADGLQKNVVVVEETEATLLGAAKMILGVAPALRGMTYVSVNAEELVRRRTRFMQYLAEH